MSLLADVVRREAFAEASRFRGEFYECLTARRDELFELVDAVLCADGAVKSPVDLTLVPEHRRGHGALYGALNHGRINVDGLRSLLAGMPLPRFDGGRLVLAVDVSPWLRPDAPCSADRLFCHVYGRAKSASQFIPGWPYSFVAVLEPGATSWTSVLDVVKPRTAKVPQGSRPSTCPVRTWRAWKSAASLTDPDGFAFRALHPRWHTVMDRGLEPETIGDVITALGAAADLGVRHTGHSARRGGADAARRAGADRKAIAVHGGWVANSAALEVYFDDGEGWEDNAMNGVL
ncbi:transposase [Streptomyces lavendulae]|uniref:transposase n=1 Tax=Streptomyces lavendulae TaxID=1914 RepID=UPI0033E16F0F